MIGRYLATLTPAQEDAVLTERLARAPSVIRNDGCRCLVGVTENWRMLGGGVYYLADGSTGMLAFAENHEAMVDRGHGPFMNVGIRFDDACLRFGEDRVNAAIRNRILRNKLLRELADVKQEASV